MLGSILGDIIGSTYEFANTKNYDFELFPQGSNYTDDSILTIAVADAILHKADYGKTIREWALRYPHPKGAYGGSFSRWMYSANTKPYGSFGNGSAMRVSSVGWLFNTEQSVLDEARKSAECTHNHPEGIKGAQAVAIAIFFSRKGKDKEFIKEYINENFGYTFNNTVDELRKTYSFNESCQGTVPESLVCFFESFSFEDAIRKAISIGGDSDTIGAIVGSIAEAFYGIPLTLAVKAKNYLPHDMLAVLDMFQKRVNNATLDISAEKKFLRELYSKLKKEFSDLFALKQDMLSQEQPFLTALYLQKIGQRKYESYCLSVELAKLKHRLALLQSFVNRNEKPDLKLVDKEIEVQFADYQQRIEAEAQRLAAAKEFLKSPFLSPEESKKMRDIYYIIVKRLHPDINPNLSERMKDLFVKAQTAYDINDLSALQQILLLLNDDNSGIEIALPTLNETIKHTEENIKILKHQIELLNSEFPFIYREKLKDEDWISAECEAADNEIEAYKAEIEKHKTYVTLLEEWKPE